MQPIGEIMNNLRFFSGHFGLFPIPRRAAVMLVALGWSSFAFCGEIHDAAKSGDLEKVKALLKNNPDFVFSRDDKYGGTPLQWTVVYGHKAVAELLLASKAEVNAKTITGQTPLHYAASKGHWDVTELLLANYAEVNSKATNGFTPLHEAALYGHKDVAELLRQHGGRE
jgi:ankyrin repeat protein